MSSTTNLQDLENFIRRIKDHRKRNQLLKFLKMYAEMKHCKKIGEIEMGHVSCNTKVLLAEASEKARKWVDAGYADDKKNISKKGQHISQKLKELSYLQTKLATTPDLLKCPDRGLHQDARYKSEYADVGQKLFGDSTSKLSSGVGDKTLSMDSKPSALKKRESDKKHDTRIRILDLRSFGENLKNEEGSLMWANQERRALLEFLRNELRCHPGLDSYMAQKNSLNEWRRPSLQSVERVNKTLSTVHEVVEMVRKADFSSHSCMKQALPSWQCMYDALSRLHSRLQDLGFDHCGLWDDRAATLSARGDMVNHQKLLEKLVHVATSIGVKKSNLSDSLDKLGSHVSQISDTESNVNDFSMQAIGFGDIPSEKNDPQRHLLQDIEQLEHVSCQLGQVAEKVLEGSSMSVTIHRLFSSTLHQIAVLKTDLISNFNFVDTPKVPEEEWLPSALDSLLCKEISHIRTSLNETCQINANGDTSLLRDSCAKGPSGTLLKPKVKKKEVDDRGDISRSHQGVLSFWEVPEQIYLACPEDHRCRQNSEHLPCNNHSSQEKEPVGLAAKPQRAATFQWVSKNRVLRDNSSSEGTPVVRLKNKTTDNEQTEKCDLSQQLNHVSSKTTTTRLCEKFQRAGKESPNIQEGNIDMVPPRYKLNKSFSASGCLSEQKSSQQELESLSRQKPNRYPHLEQASRSSCPEVTDVSHLCPRLVMSKSHSGHGCPSEWNSSLGLSEENSGRGLHLEQSVGSCQEDSDNNDSLYRSPQIWQTAIDSRVEDFSAVQSPSSPSVMLLERTSYYTSSDDGGPSE